MPIMTYLERKLGASSFGKSNSSVLFRSTMPLFYVSDTFLISFNLASSRKLFLNHFYLMAILILSIRRLDPFENDGYSTGLLFEF